MSSKVTISYTYEWEREYYMNLLKPLLDVVKCHYKVVDGHEYSHVYIPRKGSLTLPDWIKNNMLKQRNP